MRPARGTRGSDPRGVDGPAFVECPAAAGSPALLPGARPGSRNSAVDTRHDLVAHRAADADVSMVVAFLEAETHYLRSVREHTVRRLEHDRPRPLTSP